MNCERDNIVFLNFWKIEIVTWFPEIAFVDRIIPLVNCIWGPNFLL